MQNIKVFISSTFRDLNQERDYLVQKVFPGIRDKLDGITVSEVDLRWGITDEESREKRIVDLCLQYLYESKPFFVGILGERYGSVIAPEDVELSPLVEEAYPQVRDDLNQGLSVTEIEIMNGVFRAPKDMRPQAIFFLKEATKPCQGEDRAKFIKLQELKRKIVAQKDFPVFTYTELKDLDRLEKFILDSLNKGTEQTSEQTSERASARTIFDVTPMIQAYDLRYNSFSQMDGWTGDNQQLLTQLKNVIERASPVAVLEGMEGVGKSALVARLTSAADDNKRRYIYIYGDVPQIPSTNSLLLDYFLTETCRQLQSEYDQQASRTGWSGWVTRNFKKVDLSIEQNLVEEIARQKWCFVLDETCALRLRTFSPTRYLLQPIINAISYLEQEYKVKIDYRVLLVQNPGSPYSTTNDAYYRFVLPMRSTTDGWLYVDTYLKQYSKHLGTEQIKQLKTCPLMGHPRSVRLVCDYMRLFVKHEQLPVFIDQLTTFTTTDETYQLYLNQLDSMFSQKQLRRLTGFISLFSCGPSVKNLKELSGMADIDFYRAWACLSRLTAESHLGAIRWANDAIGRLVDRKYGLGDSAFRIQLASEGSQYFFDQIKDLYTPEKLQADLRKNCWAFKGDIIVAIASKCGKSVLELNSMDDMQFLQFILRNKMFELDFVRKNLYHQMIGHRIVNQQMMAVRKAKKVLDEQCDKNEASFSEVISEAANHQDEKFWQWVSLYRQPTVVELTCYLECLREAHQWDQLANELTNPEVLHYVWQTSVVIDSWNVAIQQGGISIIQPHVKDYDKMLHVSYALHNSEGIAYYSQHLAKNKNNKSASLF